MNRIDKKLKEEGKLSDELTVEMKYPDLEYFTKINFIGEDPDPYELVAKCIKRVYVGEDDYSPDSVEESRAWVEGLTNSQFDGIQDFFETMPSLRHVLKVKNPKTKAYSNNRCNKKNPYGRRYSIYNN